MNVRIYVEGAGEDNASRTKLREGFKAFIKTMLPDRDMPTIIACGGRGSAFKDFKTALRSLGAEDRVFLLVDSEAPVSAGHTPWQHLAVRPGDEWERPAGADDTQAHMMVRCMESWFPPDREAVEAWYDDGNFHANRLPPLRHGSIEPIDKVAVARGLKEATANTQKESYHKTKHGFSLLERIDPDKVRVASHHLNLLYQSLIDCLPART